MAEEEDDGRLSENQTKRTTTCRTMETQTSSTSSSKRMEETQPYEKLDIVRSSNESVGASGALDNPAYIRGTSSYQSLLFTPLNGGTPPTSTGRGRPESDIPTRHYMSAAEPGQRRRLALPRSVRERQGSVLNASCYNSPSVAESSKSSTLTTDYEPIILLDSIGQRQPLAQEGLYNYCLSELPTNGLIEHSEITPQNIYESLAIESGFRNNRKNKGCGLWHVIVTLGTILAVFIVAMVVGFLVYKYIVSVNDDILILVNTDNDGLTISVPRNEIPVPVLTNSGPTLTEQFECFSARVFLDESRMHHVISAKKFVRGITSLSGELFIVHGMSPKQISVYDSVSFNLTRNLIITDAKDPFTIVSCSSNNCLYVCDPAQQTLFRYNLTDNSVLNWTVGGKCYGLSVTKNCTVIATLYDKNQLKEFSPNGTLIKVITIESGVSSTAKPCQSIKLTSSDRFVVNHWDSKQGGVYTVNSTGHVIQNYSRTLLPTDSRDSKPFRLAVDRFDNVIISYKESGFVEILSPDLEHLGYVTIPGWNISDPRVLHLDELNRRLYVGLQDGRVFVLSDRPNRLPNKTK